MLGVPQTTYASYETGDAIPPGGIRHFRREHDFSFDFIMYGDWRRLPGDLQERVFDAMRALEAKRVEEQIEAERHNLADRKDDANGQRHQQHSPISCIQADAWLTRGRATGGIPPSGGSGDQAQLVGAKHGLGGVAGASFILARSSAFSAAFADTPRVSTAFLQHCPSATSARRRPPVRSVADASCGLVRT